MTDNTESFGYWVRRRRKALDLSQADLARQVPCSLATIKKIETDMRRPSPAMAERLAGCLGLPAGEREAFLAAARGLRALGASPSRIAQQSERGGRSDATQGVIHSVRAISLISKNSSWSFSLMSL